MTIACARAQGNSTKKEKGKRLWTNPLDLLCFFPPSVVVLCVLSCNLFHHFLISFFLSSHHLLPSLFGLLLDSLPATTLKWFDEAEAAWPELTICALFRFFWIYVNVFPSIQQRRQRTLESSLTVQFVLLLPTWWSRYVHKPFRTVSWSCLWLYNQPFLSPTGWLSWIPVSRAQPQKKEKIFTTFFSCFFRADPNGSRWMKDKANDLSNPYKTRKKKNNRVFFLHLPFSKVSWTWLMNLHHLVKYVSALIAQPTIWLGGGGNFAWWKMLCFFLFFFGFPFFIHFLYPFRLLCMLAFFSVFYLGLPYWHWEPRQLCTHLPPSTGKLTSALGVI